MLGRNRCAASRAERPSAATSVSWPASVNSLDRLREESSLSSTTRTRFRTRGSAPASAFDPRSASRRSGSAVGSQTVNSLPLPSPSLVAVTLPPCISASVRTRVRPIPSPPSERASERSPWVNSSNISGQHLGRDADAGVADLRRRVRPPRARP